MYIGEENPRIQETTFELPPHYHPVQQNQEKPRRQIRTENSYDWRKGKSINFDSKTRH